MSTATSTPHSIEVMPAVAGIAPTTELELKQAYQRLIAADKALTERGLEFGKLCYELRKQNKKQGNHSREGFEAVLQRLSIAKTTAHRWIRRYEEKKGLRAKRHEASTKTTKPKQAADSQHVGLEGNLPAKYPRSKWDADVETLGGQKKVWLLFCEFIQKQADAKRHEPGKSVH